MITAYKGFLSQLAKVLCLSEIIAEAPFPSIESQGLPSLLPVLFQLMMLEHSAILSNQAQDSELIGETCLPFASSLLYYVLC